MVDFLENGRILVPNKSGSVLIEDPKHPAVLALNFASVLPSMLYSTSVPGHYFNFGEPARFSDGEPHRVEFKAAGDVCSFFTKQVGENVYLYGTKMDRFIEWTPPARKDAVDETPNLALYQVPREDIVSMKVLTNTETHPHLRDHADQFMSYLKVLQNIKVRSISDAKKWVKQSYEKNMKIILLEGEKADRKLAADQAARGKRSTAAEHSKEAGQEARDLWKAIREAVQRAAPFYNEPFEERMAGGESAGRFINIALDTETGQPTTATIDELRAFLTYAHTLPRTHARLALPHLPTCHISANY